MKTLLSKATWLPPGPRLLGAGSFVDIIVIPQCQAIQTYGKKVLHSPGTVVDVCAGMHRNVGLGSLHMPTITASRGSHGGAYYVPGRRTCLSVHELGRLTGRSEPAVS